MDRKSCVATLLRGTGLLLLLLIGLTTNAQKDANKPGQPVRVKQFNVDAGKPAISGYDPVSYFNASKPVKGKSSNALNVAGITYWFASPASLESFRKDPARYEPQYGGWCAYAMGNDGSKVEVDPETFRILDGKLYLFYNSFFNNTLKDWNENENELKQKAEKNWTKFN
ncbi:MAG: YHS domain protein [Sphingobacteriales bacterium]|nr:MAG: YHS domain protein [Sphingobacteriales bacterium]